MPRGRPAMMPAKISRLMPLPMPRSVICSPSHMMNAVPVVRVRTVIRSEADAGIQHQALLGQNGRDTNGLQRSQNDRHVARPLRDFPTAQFAFLLDARQRLIHHGQQLEDDGRGDVGHDAQREDGHAAQVTAAEQVHQAERRSALRIEQELKLVGVHAGRGDERTQTVHGENAQCKQNPLAQVRNPEDIQKLLKHVWFSASGDDAARILPKSSVSAKVAMCP